MQEQGKPMDMKSWRQKVKTKSLSHVPLFATLWIVARQAPPSMEFSRQEYWSRLPFPSPEDLPDPGIEPRSPELRADALTSEPPSVDYLAIDVANISWVIICIHFSSVAQSCPTLRSHGLQHARPPRPSPAPGACSILCPSSWWYHPTISSSVLPFSSWLQFLLASGSFPMSQFFPSVGQIIGVSPSASVLPMNIQDLFPLELIGLISLQSKGL